MPVNKTETHDFKMTENDTANKIADDLISIGVKQNHILLVHSSLSSMGNVNGGAETVIKGILKAIGEKGTLLLPTLSYSYVNIHSPIFYVEKTPSCAGKITEYFRTREGSIRSMHPTHSVSGFGPEAKVLLNKHLIDNTPCGEHSPFRLLKNLDGQILFLGCGLKPNTSMHAIEEMSEPPYLFKNTLEYKIIYPDGRITLYNCRCHNFSGYQQRYDRIEPLLMNEGMRTGKVLYSSVHLLESRTMWEKALIELNKDPFYFVEKS